MGIFSYKKRKTEQAVENAFRQAISDDRLFEFAPYDPTSGERTGYSNYSYWGSTVKAFFQNKAALVALCALCLVLLFTLIQPLLPGQYDANRVYNDPVTGIQLQNQSPSLTTVYTSLRQETLLNYKKLDEDWYAVSNLVSTIKKRESFTVTAYLDDWVEVEYNGVKGYVKNNFQTKLKLPDDPYAVPYETRSSFTVQVYSDNADLTNNGSWLYCEASDLRFDEDGNAFAPAGTELRTIPSTNPFIFGTNNIGQDLWARVWSGTRTSLWIGFVVALFEALIGIMIGILWGYVRQLDHVLTELYNIVDNIPTTIILILVSYIMKPGVSTLIFAMSLTRWLGMSRFVRNQIVIIRDRDYNLASRCLGTSPVRIMLKNLLPYLVSVIMLRMALAIPGAIGSEVFITYIGIGLSKETPSLGNLINEGRQYVTSASLRYQLIFPTLVLSIITVSFYIIGNAFADAADPKNHV